MVSPVYLIVVNIYMEDLEQKIIATTPEDCHQRSRKIYMDDVICLVHTGKADTLQQRVNAVGPTSSIVFTSEDKKQKYTWMPSSPERMMEA